MAAVPEALERGLEERVLALWGSVLGVEAGLLDGDGLVVAEDHREFAAQRRATIRTARGTLVLAAPAEARVAVADPLAYASDVAARAQGIGLLHYLAGRPAGDRDPRVRVLGAPDRPLLASLQKAAGGAASEEAEVDVEHPLAVGIAEGGRLLAIASLLDLSNDAVDVGVLVDPAQRRRRLGAAVVCDIAERATRSEQLVQYRCNLENEASARLARACGFTLWGVLTIASRRTDDSPVRPQRRLLSQSRERYCGGVAAADLDSIRASYPGARESVYLNVAAIGLVSTRVRDAVVKVLDEHVRDGNTVAPEWTVASDRTRGRIAELIGGRAENVTYTQNTSTGNALVVNGIDWRAGDNVVVPADEFPSNFYPWLGLRRRGVEIREVPMVDGHADLYRMREMIDGRTRVVAVSAVQYTSGHRYDLAQVREICRDALLVVDGTQAVGALVIDADSDGVDALVVSAHKWMLGPLGIGFVHFSDRAMNQLHPSTTGWLSVERPFDFDHEPRLAPDGRRFESGTINAAGIAGLDATVSLVLQLGRQIVETIVLAHAAELDEQLQSLGLRVARSSNPNECSGIVITTTGDTAADAAAYQRLTERNIRCSLRVSGIRFSPHYYNTSEDLRHAADAIVAAVT